MVVCSIVLVVHGKYAKGKSMAVREFFVLRVLSFGPDIRLKSSSFIFSMSCVLFCVTTDKSMSKFLYILYLSLVSVFNSNLWVKKIS